MRAEGEPDAAQGGGDGLRAVVVAQPSYFAGLGAVFAEVPLETWKAYLAYGLVSSYAAYLSPPFEAEDFSFELHTLRGIPEMQPRWKQIWPPAKEAGKKSLLNQ